MIRADRAEEEQIERQRCGADVAVAEDESAEQPAVGSIRGVLERAIAVDEEQEQVAIA